jgi:hypothetical protein
MVNKCIIKRIIEKWKRKQPPRITFRDQNRIYFLNKVNAQAHREFMGMLTYCINEHLRKKAQWRWIRTVIRNLITLASRLVYHARRYKLSLGQQCPWFLTFRRIYILLSTT